MEYTFIIFPDIPGLSHVVIGRLAQEQELRVQPPAGRGGPGLEFPQQYQQHIVTTS